MTEPNAAAPAAPAAAAPAAPAAAPAVPAAPAAQNPASGAPAAAAAPAVHAVEPKPGEPLAAPAPKAGEPPVTPPAGDFKIPEEFKDKPWATKVKTQEDLWKQLSNAQELIGKKSIVPDLSKATPEEREAYYAQTRPKSAEEYVFTDSKIVPVTPEIQTAVRDIFMKNGVSATAGNEIIKQYQALGEAQSAQMFSPDGFKTSMETAFGKDWEKVTGHTRNTLTGLMTKEDGAMLDKLPNSYLSLIYRTLGNVVKAYGITEKNAAHLAERGGIAPTDVESVRQGIRNDLSALGGKPHTAEQHQALVDKLNATYQNDPRLASTR